MTRRLLTPTMFLQVGNTRYEVESLEHASVMFCAARDKSGFGASGTPVVTVVSDGGQEIARISYNGRVWPAGDWRTDATPLYDNRVEA